MRGKRLSAWRIMRRKPPAGAPEMARFVLFLASVEDRDMTACNGVEIVTADDMVKYTQLMG